MKATTIDKYTITALAVSLVAYPLLYSLDFFSSIFSFVSYLDWLSDCHSDRGAWWCFWLSNLVYHWIPFFFVWFALYKNKEDWSSIGLNVSWYIRHKFWFIGIVFLLIITAIIAPSIYYDELLPHTSKTIFFAPVTVVERLFMIFMAFTTGLTEEVLFRGYAFTRLKRVIKNSYCILLITIVSFLLIHGQPDSMIRSINYIIAGAAFGITFILLKLKKLEVLIFIHFIINSSLVIAP